MLKDITLRSISALHGAAPRNEKQMVAKATILSIWLWLILLAIDNFIVISFAAEGW
jgi:hypothetical protein